VDRREQAPLGTGGPERQAGVLAPPWWRRGARGALTAFAVCLPLSISGAEAALAVMLALVVAGLARGYQKWVRSALDGPLALFLGALLLSTILRGPSNAVLDAYGDLWVVGAYVATVALVRDRDNAGRLAAVLIGVTAAAAVYGIVQYFTGIDVYRDLAGRPREVEPLPTVPGRYIVIGFFPNSLTYAHSLIAPLGWAVAATLGGRGWIISRTFAACCGAVMLVALLLSTARGAWIAAAVVVGLACLVSRARRGVAVAAAAAAIAVVSFASSPALRAEARSIIDRNANAGRAAIYAANLDIVKDHPIFGLGYGHYDRLARPYYDRHPQADRRSHAHNSFLQVAADAGLVGLAAFCLLFGVLLWRGWRLVRRLEAGHPELWATAAGAWLGIVGFLVGAITQDTFADSECALPMWFAAGVLMTMDRELRGGGGGAGGAPRA
jgi:O-antigen ligase